MDSKQQQIFQMWDKLDAFGASHCDKALTYLQSELADLVGAQQVYWAATVRLSSQAASDPLLGWRAVVAQYLHSQEIEQANFKEICKSINLRPKDPLLMACLDDVGSFRVLITSEMFSALGSESQTDPANYAARNIHDSMLVAVPVGEDVESWFGIFRMGDDGIKSNFTESDRKLLIQAIRPLNWFLRQLSLSHGLLVAQKPITTSERRVLNQLLTNKSESEIAEDLNLSPLTVHTYVSRICRKFNVRGRTGLSSLWLSR